MTTAACALCGTQTEPGTACPNCGTLTPAPRPPGPVLHATAAASEATSYATQWQAILEKLRRVAAPKYRILSVLGYGGMAGVYLAEEPRLGRMVAIKVMSPGLMVDPSLVDRFVQEARTIARLHHPHIVTIYEVDEREDLHWFAMTYVEGRTLGQVLAEDTEPLPIDVVRAWLYQIGDALGYAHQHDIVHRDIKPANVLLDERGNALVTDFGIAKVADVDGGLTRTGMLVGTPSCMSPEQCSSGRITGASDQYSLGAVVYQMLTGNPPFTGPTLSVLQAHVMQQPRWLLDLRPDCPEDLAVAVHRMLEKRAEDRWPTLSAAIRGAGARPPDLDGPIREKLELLAAPAAAITVSPWTETVTEGTRKPLSVLVAKASGHLLRGRRLDWASTNTTVAAVSPEGELHAFAPGSAVLIASCGAASSTLQLTVVHDAVRDVQIRTSESAVPAGTTLGLETLVLDLDGQPLDERVLLWVSSDPAIARVTAMGVVEAIKPGATIITATTGGKTASVRLQVTAAPVVHTSPALQGRARYQTLPNGPGALTPAPTGPGLPALMTPTPGTPVPQRITPVPAIGDTIGTTEPSKRKIARVAWRAGAAGALAIAVIAVLVKALAPSAAAPEPIAWGTINIVGDLPAGATITSTSHDRGQASREIRISGDSLPPGRYTLVFNASNYQSDSREMTITAGGTHSWTPTLQRDAVDPAPGLLIFQGTIPPDATVRINGIVRAGRSNRISLTPGIHEIAITANGFQTIRDSVRVAEGAEIVLPLKFVRTAGAGTVAGSTGEQKSQNQTFDPAKASLEIDAAARAFASGLGAGDEAQLRRIYPGATADQIGELMSLRGQSPVVEIAIVGRGDVDRSGSDIFFNLIFRDNTGSVRPFRFHAKVAHTSGGWKFIDFGRR